jgi:hypothetical protein
VNAAESLSIDLSKATKLKEVVFKFSLNPRWIVKTLRTVTNDHRNLRQISLDLPYAFLSPEFEGADPARVRQAVGETVHTGWSELDRLLIQLWESHSIRPKALYSVPSWVDRRRARICMESLLPETAAGGIVDLIERDSGL